MKYDPYGPFTLPRSDDNLIFVEDRGRAGFWREIDQHTPGLSNACGCYVFALRSGGGVRPWYVGKAERQSFKSEVLTQDKITKYNSVLQAGKKGTPVLFLFSRITPERSAFSRPSSSNHRDIQYLEKMLITLALDRNPDLVNINETKMLRNLVVPGLINTPQGKLSKAAQAAKSLLGF